MKQIISGAKVWSITETRTMKVPSWMGTRRPYRLEIVGEMKRPDAMAPTW
jgi:hypothetical protein